MGQGLQFEQPKHYMENKYTPQDNGKSPFFTRDTSSNGCICIVMLVFSGVNQAQNRIEGCEIPIPDNLNQKLSTLNSEGFLGSVSGARYST